MREDINFYYNLQIKEVENWDDICRFKIDNCWFYFVPFIRDQKELDDILKVINELKTRKILVHDFVFNKYGEVITSVYNQKYVLLKINCILDEYSDIYDIHKFSNSLILNSKNLKLYQNSWAQKWSKKLDYFEYQVHELGKNKNVLLDSFSYYLGLGENAISYVNLTNQKYEISTDDLIVLSHRRIGYPNYLVNYLNPLSFIFDLEVRDIAEYLKSAFFAGEDTISILKSYLKLKRFSIYSYQMLYARLLYPSYYFDIYDKIMNNNKSEDELIPILEKLDDYELFLQKAYDEISKYAMIDRVEWLLKKEL